MRRAVRDRGVTGQCSVAGRADVIADVVVRGAVHVWGDRGVVMGDISNFKFDTIYISLINYFKVNIDITIKILIYRVWSIFRLT